MNMIEKVARAIQECGAVTGYEARLPEAKLYAKAAIEAMRDLPAGFNLDERRMFNAAIDKALED